MTNIPIHIQLSLTKMVYNIIEIIFDWHIIWMSLTSKHVDWQHLLSAIPRPNYRMLIIVTRQRHTENTVKNVEPLALTARTPLWKP